MSTYTVTSTADDGSSGTLRDAINQANLAGGTITEIDFNIGTSGSAQTISVTSQLPTLTANGVFINGLSQGGSGNTTRLITLDGTRATNTTDGMVLQGSNDIVSGLIIQGFGSSGDTVDVLNVIDVAGSNDTIGGTAPGAGNVVSFNNNNTSFYNSDAPPIVVNIEAAAIGTLVRGNYIGTDVTGTQAVSNINGFYAPYGIYVSGPDTTIGGTSTDERNLISGNFVGVVIRSPSSTTEPSGVVVQGNYVGTDITGTKSVANFGGIEDQGTDNSIGGTASGAGNVISGNGRAGGIYISSGDQVQGNYIGTDPTGGPKPIPTSAAATATPAASASSLEVTGTQSAAPLPQRATSFPPTAATAFT